MNRLRLLPYGVFDPEYNMALDAALLRSVAAGKSPATFRFYGWNRPTLSLGRSQEKDSLGLAQVAEVESVAIVQRPTGGAVAVHGRDLSYALVVPFPCEFLPCRPKACYCTIHQAFAEALQGLGCSVECVPQDYRADYRAKIYCGLTLSACDIVSGGRKLVGSAQRRVAGALLQHGFILLDENFGWVRQLLGSQGQNIAQASVALSALLPGGRLPDGGQLRTVLQRAFEVALGVEFEEAPLSAEEQQEVKKQGLRIKAEG